MSESAERTVLPVLDTLVAMRQRYMQFMAQMVREPVDMMTKLPRANLNAGRKLTGELIAAHEQTLNAHKQLVESTGPVLDLMFSLPGVYANIIARAINAPIEASVVQFKKVDENVEEYQSETFRTN